MIVTWNLLPFCHELVKYLEFGGEWFCTYKLFTFKMCNSEETVFIFLNGEAEVESYT